jgi:hypothetical protein
MDDDLDPDETTRLLAVRPTRIQRKGEAWREKEPRTYKKSGWFLSTKGVLSSRDARHHFDWLLERIGGKRDAFTIFHSRGYLVDVCCRWDSKSGHGGPCLSPPQMRAFAESELEVWFDVYVGELEVAQAG